jgi:diguanylate cyclase (GGDEF)-like protein
MAMLLLISAREMRASHRASARLGYLARHDALTGLANRRAFHEALEQAIGAGTKTGQRFGLLLMDLDGFKRVNDRLGHEAGDHMLVRVAKSLKATRRESDVLARLGGDEFALLVPDLASDEAGDDLVARIKLAIASANTGHLGPAVSASVGFALFPDHASSKAELLGLADERMYSDKRRTQEAGPKRPQPRSAHSLNDPIGAGGLTRAGQEQASRLRATASRRSTP